MEAPSNTKAPPPRKQRNSKYVRWTARMDSVLNNVLLDQHAVGNHSPNGWKALAYTAIISAIKKECDVAITKDNIISRLKTWNNLYETVNKILSTSGFSWDCHVNMIHVEDERVWEAYVKTNPDARPFRNKVIDNWEDLVVICGQDHTNGEGANCCRGL